MKRRLLWGLMSGLGMSVCVITATAQILWNPYPGNPVFGPSALDPSVMLDSTTQTYSMWFVDPVIGVRKATSADGTHWNASAGAALVPGAVGSYDHLIYSAWVVKYGGGYYMYYTASRTGDTLAISLATSSDGELWQRNPKSPVLKPGNAGSWDYPDIAGVKVAVVKGTFLMWYGGSNLQYVGTGLATSTDGLTWSKSPSNPVLQHGDDSSPDAVEAGVMAVTVRDSVFYMIYRTTSIARTQAFGLATSTDGTHWQKIAGNPIYPASRGGWDSYAIGGGSLLWANSGFRFWWCGTNGGGWGIGLASIQFTGLIDVAPKALDFGPVRTGRTDTLSMLVSNVGFKDTLKVSSITSNNPRFGSPAGSMSLPPGASGRIVVWYAPVNAGRDTGTISIASNDPGTPLIGCQVTGRGFALTVKPAIDTLAVVPHTSNQIRVNWMRSLLDTAGAADQVVQYSIWRLVPGGSTAGSASRPPSDILPSSSLIGPLWDFILTVPAIGFDRYSTVIPAYIDYNLRLTANVIMVAAHTKSLGVYESDPDTILVDPPPLTGVHESGNSQAAATYSLDQNFPNPFNPATIIRYTLPRASAVTLSVYNMLGQQVALVVDTYQDAGSYNVRFDASGLASGVYLYRLKAEGFVQSRRLLLLK